jgi:hypothetical protein
MSATTVVLIAVAAVLAGITLGWGGRRVALQKRLVRRAAERRFAREFAALVDGTELDWSSLRGPGHGPSASTSSWFSSSSSSTFSSSSSSTISAAAAFADPTDDVAMLTPRALSAADQDYYAASWRNVRGEFAAYPPSGLMLAMHLTANLLLNRGLLPVDTARPTMLPESWTFASARGYRDALRISARTESDRHESVTAAELNRAMELYEDFYWEMLTLTPAEFE